MTDLQVFLEFKEACPASKEGFEPSAANRHRWLHHIQAVNKTHGFPKVERDCAALDELRRERKVSSIEQMPWYIASRYIQIAGCFPGFEVFACGSRVRGGYVDAWDSEEIRAARCAAGMSPKQASDFDFWVRPAARQVGELPKRAERVRCIVPESEKILVPMWDFKKLPVGEYARVLELLAARDVEGLKLIHDQFQLSPNNYCCNLQPIENWFLYAAQNGLLQTEAETLAVAGS